MKNKEKPEEAKTEDTKTLKIFYDDYKLEYAGPPLVLENEVCEGYLLRHNNIIRISSHLSPHRKNKTVLHEVIHAFEDVLEMSLKEEDVDKLAICMYSFIMDNKEFIKEMME